MLKKNLLATLILLLAILLAFYQQVVAADNTILPQTSPAWLADVAGPTGNVVIQSYPKDEDIKAGPLPAEPYQLDLSTYPKPLQKPATDHPEVQNVIRQLDWSKVPQIPVRTIKVWAVDTSGYDSRQDPDCWWSASTCKRPKLSYLPEDIYMCPTPGDWGLNYDDGPLRVWSFNETEKQWQEPRFYNFLVNYNKQKATLFCKSIYMEGRKKDKLTYCTNQLLGRM